MLVLSLLAVTALASDDVSDAVYQQLSQRHGTTCEALWELGEATAVRDGLLKVATEATMPPWAPLNAAGCLMERLGTDEDTYALVKGWMLDSDKAGLALVVVQNVDTLEEAKALELAKLAVARAQLDPRFALYAQPALQKSKFKTIVDLAPNMVVPTSDTP